MRNKSKKRIKHEQRVRIAQLERQLMQMREMVEKYNFDTIESKCFIPPYARRSVHYEDILRTEYERACRGMLEKLMRSGAVEKVQTRELSVQYGWYDCYTFRLRVLKKSNPADHLPKIKTPEVEEWTM